GNEPEPSYGETEEHQRDRDDRDRAPGNPPELDRLTGDQPLDDDPQAQSGHEHADQQREGAGAHPQRGAQLVAERPHRERATDQDEDSPGQDVREGPAAPHVRRPRSRRRRTPSTRCRAAPPASYGAPPE